MNIALLGVGLMGAPMTKRLIDAGYHLHLWNRTAHKLEHFRASATLHLTPASALAEADIAITMLENGSVVDEVIYQSGAYRALPAGSLIIDMSSIPPATARQHAAQVEAAGAEYLDAPVSGGTVGALQGTLSIMAGGKQEAFERARSVFAALGTPHFIGPVGSGQLCKLANQAIVGITIGAVSEALLLAAQGGADPVAVRAALSGGFAASRILELHGQRMLERNFAPGARARVQLKDLRTILDTAREENLTLPLSQRVYESYLALIANGHEDVDHSGLLLQLEELNGVRLTSGGGDGHA